jgi:hypothetical protein
VVKTSISENKEWYPIETGGVVLEATVNNSMVCASNVPSNVKPTVKSANGNCAFWRAYKFNDDPVGNGFFAGMSYNNKSAYVGRGWVSDEMVPGRVQVAATAGVYAEFWNQDKFLTYPEYLVVPENCKCEWVRALDALTRVGLVITNDQTRDAGTLVGLVQLPNGQIAIAKATRQWNDMFYMNEFGKTVFNAPTTRVLVCEDASFQAKTTTVAPKVTASPTTCREFELILGDCFRLVHISYFYSNDRSPRSLPGSVHGLGCLHEFTRQMLHAGSSGKWKIRPCSKF